LRVHTSWENVPQPGDGNRAISASTFSKTCLVARYDIKLQAFCPSENISWLLPCPQPLDSRSYETLKTPGNFLQKKCWTHHNKRQYTCFVFSKLDSTTLQTKISTKPLAAKQILYNIRGMTTKKKNSCLASSFNSSIKNEVFHIWFGEILRIIHIWNTKSLHGNFQLNNVGSLKNTKSKIRNNQCHKFLEKNIDCCFPCLQGLVTLLQKL